MFMANIRLSHLVTTVSLVAFSALLAFGLQVPIYADEVSTKMTQATVFTNGGRMLTAIPQCFPSLTTSIPVSWYPAAAIYQTIYNGLDPLMIRISGVIIAMLYVLTTALGLKRVVSEHLPFEYVLTGFVAVLGLGVLPLTLILSRSEQWLLLLLTYFIFVPLIFQVANFQRLISTFHVVIFITCTSLFYYIHPKAAFFFPVVIVSGWITFRTNRILQVVTSAFAIFCIVQSVVAAKELFSCPDAPILAAAFSKQTTSLSNLLQQPGEVLLELASNLISFPMKVIRHLIFQPAYQSHWLPSVSMGNPAVVLVRVVNVLIASSILLVIGMGLLFPPMAIANACISRFASHIHVLVGALWVSVVCHLVIYRSWHFYTGVLLVGIFLLLVALSLPAIPWSGRSKKIGKCIISGLATVFLLSALTLFISFAARFYGKSSEHQIGVSGQPLSVPTFSFFTQRDLIRSFSQSCGITGDRSKRLVVDDLTYFAFDALREPIHLVYVSDSGMGADIKGAELIDFLNKLGSPGIVAQCTFMPEAVRKIAREEGNLCCIKLLGSGSE